MTEPRTDRDTTPESSERPTQAFQYPVNHVVGIIETPAQLESAVAALETGGFLASEIAVGTGQATGDALDASTGRTGLAHLAIRVAEHLGISNDEMDMKDRYEQALRDGQFVIAILAPSDARKELAAQMLRAHGAHFVNFLGRFTIESMHR